MIKNKGVMSLKIEMMKLIKVNVLIMLLMLSCRVALSQTDSVAIEQRLGEVEISANRTDVSYARTGRVVAVIDKQQMSGLQVNSVQDVLDYVSGVDLRQRGVDGIQADVSIRGGSFDQVMILLNGVNVTDPQTGHFSLNLPIDFSAVERIEIIEGPGARVLGPNAFSGAVNFITNSTDANEVMFQQHAGDYGFVKTNGSIGYKTGALVNFASASFSKSDGYTTNTDYQQYSLFYNGRYEKDKESVEFQTGFTDKAYGANAFYSAKYPNQYERTKTLISSLKYNYSGKVIKLTPSVYWRRNQDRFELFRDTAPAWYTTHNYHLTDVYGAAVNATIHSVLGTTAVGGEVRAEAIWSNNLGVAIDNPIEVPGEDGHYFTKSSQRSNQSIFLEHTYAKNGLTVSGGVLINRNTSLDFKARYYPGLDVSYLINQWVKVYGSVNQSFRMPTFTDLYYSTSVAMGNKDLKPEEITGYEFGLKFYTGYFNFQANGIYRDATNLIDWGRQSSAEKYQSMNISEMTSYGYQLKFQLNPQLIPFVHQLNLDYIYLTQDRSADASYESYYVMDYLRHNFVGKLEHRIYSQLSGVVTCRYQDRQGSYTDAAGASVDYKAVFLTDYQINWNAHTLSYYIGASNIFNKQYVDIGNVPMPGVWVRAGITLRLDI